MQIKKRLGRKGYILCSLIYTFLFEAHDSSLHSLRKDLINCKDLRMSFPDCNNKRFNDLQAM